MALDEFVQNVPVGFWDDLSNLEKTLMTNAQIVDILGEMKPKDKKSPLKWLSFYGAFRVRQCTQSVDAACAYIDVLGVGYSDLQNDNYLSFMCKFFPTAFHSKWGDRGPSAGNHEVVGDYLEILKGYYYLKRCSSTELTDWAHETSARDSKLWKICEPFLDAIFPPMSLLPDFEETLDRAVFCLLRPEFLISSHPPLAPAPALAPAIAPALAPAPSAPARAPVRARSESPWAARSRQLAAAIAPAPAPALSLSPSPTPRRMPKRTSWADAEELEELADYCDSSDEIDPATI